MPTTDPKTLAIASRLEELSKRIEDAADVMRRADPSDSSPERAHALIRQAGEALAHVATAARNVKSELDGTAE